jgi:LmbE family N-acetylglucosaminyl deacetylase
MIGLGLPDREEPLTLLLLGAHSDDIEIGCGGTILRTLAERRDVHVHWVVFAATGARRGEAEASATAFLKNAATAHVTLHAFRESYFPFVGAEIKDAFEDLKQVVSPDIIFTHRRDDEHQDHRTIGQLTWNAFRDHLIAEYEIPKYEGDLAQPNLFVPLDEDTAVRKIELLITQFATQLGRRWFRPETFRAVLTLRGLECNAPSGLAEGFHVRKMILTS